MNIQENFPSNFNNVFFVPYQIKDRIDVTQLSNEKITEAIKNSDVFKQLVILQDLLIAGKKMETREQRNMVALAAELYIKAPEDTQRDFLQHLVEAGLDGNFFLKIFAKAMMANYIYHASIECITPGSSGMSKEELKYEEKVALKLEEKTG